jgi:hypothetical protein
VARTGRAQLPAHVNLGRSTDRLTQPVKTPRAGRYDPTQSLLHLALPTVLLRSQPQTQVPPAPSLDARESRSQLPPSVLTRSERRWLPDQHTRNPWHGHTSSRGSSPTQRLAQTIAHALATSVVSRFPVAIPEVSISLPVASGRGRTTGNETRASPALASEAGPDSA